MKDLSTHNLKVLVVEDNKTNQMIINGILTQLGIKTEFADDGLEALEKVKTKDNDLVFMDLQLPKMDGYDTTKLIRNMDDSYFKNLPIVALTSSILKIVNDDAKAAGINDLLSKSFKINDFYNVISAQLNLVEEGGIQIRVKEEEKHKAAQVLGDIPQIMETMSRGDVSFKNELAKLYIENIIELKQVFTNAIDTNNADAAAKIAHKVNFTLNTLEAELLKQLIKKGKELVKNTDISKDLINGFNKAFSDASDQLIKALEKIVK